MAQIKKVFLLLFVHKKKCFLQALYTRRIPGSGQRIFTSMPRRRRWSRRRYSRLPSSPAQRILEDAGIAEPSGLQQYSPPNCLPYGSSRPRSVNHRLPSRSNIRSWGAQAALAAELKQRLIAAGCKIQPLDPADGAGYGRVAGSHATVIAEV